MNEGETVRLPCKVKFHLYSIGISIKEKKIMSINSTATQLSVKKLKRTVN